MGTPEGVPESPFQNARHKGESESGIPQGCNIFFPRVPGVSLADSLNAPATGWQPSRLAEAKAPNSSGGVAARLPTLAFGRPVEAAEAERLPRVAGRFLEQ